MKQQGTGNVFIAPKWDPDEEHWHGAMPDRFMPHVAIQEADAKHQVVSWSDHMANQDYNHA